MREIVCSQIEKSYRNNRAVNKLSCSIEGGKIIGLIGRNGAGKSTWLKLLAGHLKPSDGEIRIFGENPFNNLKVASNLILIEDTMTFPSFLNLGELFKMASEFYLNWQGELAKRLLAYADIPLNSYHHLLSKGQASTFNLIYGLAARCAITLLDEPMNGMDEGIRSDMYRAILKEYIAYPRTIIISSHYLQEIEHLLEEIMLIDGGEIVLHSSLEEVNQMLVRLTGEVNAIKEMTGYQDMLYERQSAISYEAIIERNKLDLTYAEQTNVLIQSLSASEVCRLLTNKSKGGIDDVFKS
ncbi:ATP-binding cassette domain-containing protein [Ureibacillus sp. GCM10028918]|uniref:ATP-binding cassette domain-containing protein n=1 Tax=Ureibacillus sp. GCM10028918 TaxID=3273429 RepID=UPI0036227E58